MFGRANLLRNNANLLGIVLQNQRALAQQLNAMSAKLDELALSPDEAFDKARNLYEEGRNAAMIAQGMVLPHSMLSADARERYAETMEARGDDVLRGIVKGEAAKFDDEPPMELD